MKKAFSHILGFILCGLAILPPFCNEATGLQIAGTNLSSWHLSLMLTVNSFHWVYFTLLTGLLAIYLCHLRVDPLVKIFGAYMYAVAYLSKAPYISFNALLFIIPAIYLFVLIRNFGDKKILINWVVSLFWFEILVCVIQLMGRDTLINFNRPQKIFLGTVMQHMRTGSLFAIMSPFLLLRSKLYIAPLVFVAFLVYSSSFALSLAVGVFIYFLLADIPKVFKRLGLTLIIAFAIGHSLYNITSFRVAFTCGRIPVWGKIFMTGLGATYTGGIITFENLKDGLIRSLTGHGLNLFPYLYPALIKDANPFAQCHNDWLQLFWELGWLSSAP